MPRSGTINASSYSGTRKSYFALPFMAPVALPEHSFTCTNDITSRDLDRLVRQLRKQLDPHMDEDKRKWILNMIKDLTDRFDKHKTELGEFAAHLKKQTRADYVSVKTIQAIFHSLRDLPIHDPQFKKLLDLGKHGQQLDDSCMDF
ncbi:hypothetical protein AXG93_1939s1030 [Marchantia polymorpha subsp. ruderalis]|uniref:Uncharacterized protein n=1 Tax=Marchantia polymorpha subsp. ruderalis TaxID=1480154 RepID=A0A176VYS5_MARPO|nr:hypothetical protein AXG93_1939s1030 [Marchantia polymorpha subsp. ruderalis]